MEFFTFSCGFKVCKPVIIGKSKVPRIFGKLLNPSKPYGIRYFHSKRGWIAKEIMIQAFPVLDRKLDIKSRKVLLFLDNSPSHCETFHRNLKNIKLLFFSKNATSQLQPCDVSIFRNFKLSILRL